MYRINHWSSYIVNITFTRLILRSLSILINLTLVIDVGVVYAGILAISQLRTGDHQ